MAQIIRLKRGLETDRQSITPSLGEIIYTTDNTEVFIGDGLTPGGVELGYLNKRTGGTIANLTITGNLTVNGTTTTVNSNDVTIGDATIYLNSDLAEDAIPSEDAGLIVNRGIETDTAIYWDETNENWSVINADGSNDRILTTADSMLKSISADSGSFSSTSHEDTFNIYGDSVITTTIVGDTLNIDHDFVPRSDSSSDHTAIASSTFDVIDSIDTTDEGHITGINLKTITMPAGYTGETIPVSQGGTGVETFTQNGVIYGNGTEDLQATSVGAWDAANGVGQLLSVDESGAPTWTDTIDGGTF